MQLFFAIITFTTIMGALFLINYIGAIHFANYAKLKPMVEIIFILIVVVGFILPAITVSK